MRVPSTEVKINVLVLQSDLLPLKFLMCAHSPGGFGEDFLRNFPQRDVEFEHGRFRAAPPSGNFPMCADELDIWPCRQVEQERNFLAIKLLRKSRDRFGIPSGTICGSEDAHVERFLLDDVGDGERQQKNPALRPTHVGGGPVSFGVNDGSFGNEEGFYHDAEILAESEDSRCDA